MDTDIEPAGGPMTRISPWQKLVGVVGLVVVVWVGIDSPLIDAWFTDGSGDMEHGPGGGPPPEDPEPSGEPPDVGEGEHVPMEHGSGGSDDAAAS
jgi:hypothetical protein